ncbi:MAG: class D sortase [Acidimicrobiales bacterium]
MVGGLLLLVAAAGVAYPIWWNHRSSSVGHELIKRALAGTAPTKNSVRTCRSPTTTALGTLDHPGLLTIPDLGLKAPVLQGIDDAVFNVAVGHDPSSVWPGSNGESLLLAHDVSYFSGLDRVKVGEEVTWIAGCREDFFRVVSHEIVPPGTAIAVPTGGTAGLALITCWPTDALFWTTDRYVVEAVFTGGQFVDLATSASPPPPLRLSVPAPAVLKNEGLSLGRSGVLAGTLRTSGSSSPSFSEGPDALAAANLALSDYAAADKTAVAQNHSWWKDLALAGVALPAPWSLRYETNVTLSVTGNIVEGATLSSPAATVTLTVRNGSFYVASVTPS